VGDPGVVGAWWIQVSFASGGGTALQMLDATTVSSGANPLDGMDIDGNGDDEFFVYLGGAGSEARFFGLYDVIGCTIHRADLNTAVAGDPPLRFDITFGISCNDTNADGLIDSFTYSTGDFLGVESDYTITRRHYSLSGGDVFDVGTDVVVVPQTDPTVEAQFGKITCDGVIG